MYNSFLHTIQKLKLKGIDNEIAIFCILPHYYITLANASSTIDDLNNGKYPVLITDLVILDKLSTYKRKVNHGYFIESIICKIEKHTLDHLKIHLRFFKFSSQEIAPLNLGDSTERFAAYGMIEKFGDIYYMKSPHIITKKHMQFFQNNKIHYAPVYKTMHSVSAYEYMDVFIHLRDFRFKEFISDEIRKKHHTFSVNEAINKIHYPDDSDYKFFQASLQKAIRSLSIEEGASYYLSSSSEIANIAQSSKIVIPIRLNQDLWQKSVIDRLPFHLTKGQNSAIEDIMNDFKQKKHVFRLIQGDVGSGKTLVFLAAVFQVAINDLRSIILTPTTILANQHYHEILKYFQPLNIPVFLLIGSHISNKTTINDIEKLKNAVIITSGTIFSKYINFLHTGTGLIVLDEQHKYGVERINEFTNKSQHYIYKLLLTATPIPRTLFMSSNRLLDISIISDKPKTRQDIATLVFPSRMRQIIMRKILNFLKRGRQVYWLCPTINQSKGESYDLGKIFQILQEFYLDYKVGYLHGKMQNAKKIELMQKFKKGEFDILLGTKVLEVGLDVPNATIMVIEAANYFSLSSLHQIRGRVGRGDHKSYCVLFYTSRCSEEGRRKLNIIKNNLDGYAVAQYDLSKRGGGDILGEKQSGKKKWRILSWQLIPTLMKEIVAYSEYILCTNRNNDLVQEIIHRWKHKNEDSSNQSSTS